ncbi:MAG TPA: hypothetical protein DCS63_02230 [Elusimicrobia bacterium]|nr:hypothetical protein [Elusimicrobiota bacterium]
MSTKNKNIYILSSFEFSGIGRALARAAAPGIAARVETGIYGSGAEKKEIPKDALLIIALDLYSLFPDFFYALLPMHCSEIEARCNAAIEKISALADRHNKNGGKVLINGFYYPPRLGASIFDFQNSEGQMVWIERLNAKLTAFAETRADIYIFGLQYYMFQYGAGRAICRERMYSENGFFSRGFSAYLGGKYAQFLSALFTPRKKCLVVDLDNTLWGGILGEDGAAGIAIGGTGAGAVYRDIQREILQYADQGILLAINSKNDEAAVKEVFEGHPGMALKWDDFAARLINWENKAANLRAIAAKLNIGTDSLVFIDDSPYEVELVRASLPEVEAIRLTGRPRKDLATIRGLTSFDFLKYSEEDISRKKYYQAEQRRNAARAGAAAPEEYYRGLEMRAEISRADRSAVTRIAQLTQKTNQFNLTTRRYTPGEILAAMESADRIVYSLRLSDRFGDSGIVGTAVVRKDTADWEIETFLLSCRVIGRTVETALLAFIQADAVKAGAERLIGRYLPTDRNGVAKDFYKNNGFTRAGRDWVLRRRARKIAFPAWIKPVRPGKL